jgi:hypothetical protein
VRNDEEILAQEIAKAGALGAKIGNVAAGAIDWAELGAIGAGVGAGLEAATPPSRDRQMEASVAWVTRRLPTEVEVVTTDLELPAARVLTVALQALRQAGEVVEDPIGIEAPTITGIVKAGWLNMNPAIVRVSAVPLEENLTQVVVSATAKEGLLKQGTANKAAERIQALVLTALEGGSSG